MIFKQDFESKRIDLVKRVCKKYGSVSILVNCAGVMASSSFFDGNAEDLDKVFCINTKAPFILSKDCFEIMKINKWGRIVNISSFVVPYGMGRNASIHYAASKAALETLTTGLSRIGAKYNILVNAIRPGLVATDMQLNRKNLKRRLNMVPLKRMAQPEEIASVAAFLIMETGNFITGQTICITGGE